MIPSQAVFKFIENNISSKRVLSVIEGFEDTGFSEALRLHLLEEVAEKSYISTSATVHPTAIIKNSWIGDNVKVWENVTIRDSVIYDSSTIGHCSEIVRSIVGPECSIPRFNYVGSSFFGAKVRLGGSVTFASRRLDDEDIKLSVGGMPYDTMQKKFGAIVGDQCQIGFSTHVNPGTLIGANCTIMPFIELGGCIAAGSIVSIAQEVHIQRKNRFRAILKSGSEN